MYTIHLDIRNYIIIGELGEGKAKQVINILEFDIVIKATKLVKRRALCQNIDMVAQVVVIIGELQPQQNLKKDQIKQLYYYFRTRRCPKAMNKSQMRRFRLQDLNYFMVDDNIYYNNFYGTLLRFVSQDESTRILHEFHYGFSGGHFS